MGMQSLSPTVISTPLKLLLFIAVDGWSRLLQGLVLSYAPP
jgi:type III secretion protein R